MKKLFFLSMLGMLAILLSSCSSFNSYGIKGDIIPEKVSTLKLQKNPNFTRTYLELIEIDGEFVTGLYCKRVLTDSPGGLGNLAFKGIFYIPPGQHTIRFKLSGDIERGTKVIIISSGVDGVASFMAHPGNNYEFQTRWQYNTNRTGLWSWRLVEIETGTVVSGAKEW